MEVYERCDSEAKQNESNGFDEDFDDSLDNILAQKLFAIENSVNSNKIVLKMKIK